MKWFRFYDEVLDDPKCQRLTPIMFRHWVNLLCIANRSTERGVLPDLEDIAFGLRLSETKTMSVLNHLYRGGLLDFSDDGLFSPHGWINRQRVSDDVAQRVTKHREKNAEQSLQKQKSNVTETLPHVRATEAEAETDVSKDTGAEAPRPASPSPVSPSKKSRPENGPAQRLIAAFCDATGIEQLPDYPKAGGQAKQLVNAGVKPEDIPNIVTWLNSQDWIDGGIDLGTVVSQLTKYRTSQTTRTAGPPGVELLPGETAEQIGPDAWNLVGRDGQMRKIRPDYCGVVFDTRKHLYEGLNTFTDEVAKAREGKHGHANTGD